MWKIDNKSYKNITDAIGAVIDNMDDSYYEAALYDIYGDEVKICGYMMDPVYIFREMDPIAYRCGLNDYYDSLSGDIETDLDSMDDGEEKKVFGVSVEYVSENWDEIQRVAEELGWIVTYYADDHSKTVTFEQCSPLGEDLCYEISYDNIDDVTKYIEDLASDYDPDEHVKDLIRASDEGFAGVPTSVSALIEDAERIQDMLTELWDGIWEVI